MKYPQINSTLAGENIGYFFLYANQVTNNMFGVLMVFAFFIVVLIGSSFMQLRFRATIRFETSLLASSFATLGFATILQMYSGILAPFYFFIIIGITILALIWNVLSSE